MEKYIPVVFDKDLSLALEKDLPLALEKDRSVVFVLKKSDIYYIISVLSVKFSLMEVFMIMLILTILLMVT